jgi:hypothetical protein
MDKATLEDMADQLEDIIGLCDRMIPKCKSRVNSVRPNVFNLLLAKLQIVKGDTTYAFGLVKQEICMLQLVQENQQYYKSY